MSIFHHSIKVLFLLSQLFVLTTQDQDQDQDQPEAGGFSSSCQPATAQQAAFLLNATNGGPLGKFNKNYMAFTWNDAENNFKNLITQQKGNFSAAASMSPSSFPFTSSIGTCTSSFPNCNECPVVTDLGAGSIPRFINEVTCEAENELCGRQSEGYCKNTSINQEFVMEECDPTTGQMKRSNYIQEIRSCCNCFLF